MGYIKLNNRTVAFSEFDQMSDKELSELADELQLDCNIIRSKIDDVVAKKKDTGIAVNNTWLKNIRSALRMKDFAKQKVFRILKTRKDKYRRFYNIAEKLLNTETFENILNAVNQESICERDKC